MTALNTGIQAARQSYDQPVAAPLQNTLRAQSSRFDLYQSYYDNTTFNYSAQLLNNITLNRWGSSNNSSSFPSSANYLNEVSLKQGLYRHIRLIYNPTRRLVDFYPRVVYPGVLSEDGLELPDGVQSAAPFPKDMSPELKKAIAQFWQWSNFQSLKSKQVRETAKLGVIMIEIVDDVARGKVRARLVKPQYVTDLALDMAGNVRSYALEFSVNEPLFENSSAGGGATMAYNYRKEVDKFEFRYFKDGQPFDYDGFGAVQPNRYGFCPAAWVKHFDSDELVSDPVIAGSIYKINELNNLASLVHDQVKKKVAAPFVFWSDGFLTNLMNKAKAPSSDDIADPNADRETVTMIKGPAGGSVSSLSSDLDLGDAAIYMDKLIREIEQDHRELVMWEKLSGMTQTTGPAVSRLMGDVVGTVLEVQASHDRPVIAIAQMAVAIAGQNLKDRIGGWANPTEQQKNFSGYDLQSFERGLLDFVILPRPLVAPTQQEVAQEKTTWWTGVGLAVTAGADLEFALDDFGMDQAQIAKIDASNQQAMARIQTAQQLAAQDTIPLPGQWPDESNGNGNGKMMMKSMGNRSGPGSSDQAFIQNMIPHHQATITMAQTALVEASRSQIITLAKNIIAAQTKEIAQMEKWYKQWFGMPVPAGSPMEFMTAQVAGSGSGAGDGSSSGSKTGNGAGGGADRRFIEQMIPHHQAAVEMACQALPTVAHSELRQTMLNIITSQTAEIAQMMDWYQAWFGGAIPGNNSNGGGGQQDQQPMKMKMK